MSAKKSILEEYDGVRFIRPRYYADANSRRSKDHWDYENMPIQWGDQEDYVVARKIGRGKYCEAFEGFHQPTGRQIVVKLLKPVKKRKIRRELKILQNLTNGPNIVRILDYVKDPIAKTPSFIFEYCKNRDFKELYPTFHDYDIRFYTLKVLKALDYCHSMGVVHRDVKPHNIMIDHENRELKLIDWGLAEFYHLHTPMNVRVASRYYKGPELLLEYQLYDYSLDIWSLGCMLAGMVFIKEPFFRGSDNYDQLLKIARVLGTDAVFIYVNKYNIELDPNLDRMLDDYPPKPLDRFVTQKCEHLCDPHTLDLLEKMLVIDHANRILPKECFNHPYYTALQTMPEPTALPARQTGDTT